MELNKIKNTEYYKNIKNAYDSISFDILYDKINTLEALIKCSQYLINENNENISNSDKSSSNLLTPFEIIFINNLKNVSNKNNKIYQNIIEYSKSEINLTKEKVTHYIEQTKLLLKEMPNI